MFVGSIIYNGELRMVMKGVVTVLSYALFLFIINADRVSNALAGKEVRPVDLIQAHAANATVIMVTIAYITGMVLGVMVTSHARKVQKHAKLIAER